MVQPTVFCQAAHGEVANFVMEIRDISSNIGAHKGTRGGSVVAKNIYTVNADFGTSGVSFPGSLHRGGDGGRKDEGAGKMIWQRKFCRGCQVSGKPPRVYTLHNTAECRPFHQIEPVGSSAVTITRGQRTMRRTDKVQDVSHTELCDKVGQFAKAHV